MADDAGAADAQQRGAAELLVLEPGLEPLQAGGDLGPGVAGEVGHEPGQLFLERREQELDGPLAGLEQDVADEPVADDDADVPFVDVAALDVADEPGGPGAVLIQVARVERVSSFPFSSSVPTFKQADAGAGHAQDRLGVDRRP